LGIRREGQWRCGGSAGKGNIRDRWVPRESRAGALLVYRGPYGPVETKVENPMMKASYNLQGGDESFL
jgi:hypothetical protein